MPKLRPSVISFLWLLGVALAGFVLLIPFVNVQGWLAQGDHGRDCYIFERILYGDMPYRDFWWVYGPLMPYYFALFFKILGPSVLTALIAHSFLIFLSGIFIFLALNTIVPLWAAFLGACWFWLFYQGFFFTYDHTGGILCLSAFAFFFLSYIKTDLRKMLWYALAVTFVLLLIRVNFGLIALATCVVTAAMTPLLPEPCDSKDQRKKHSPAFFYTSLFIIPLTIVLIYAFFLYGLSNAEIRQCLPYSAEQEQPYVGSLMERLQTYFQMFFSSLRASQVQLALCLTVLACTVHMIFLALKKRIVHQREIILCLIFLGLFLLLMLHEYLFSGFFYRALWQRPISVIFIFTVIGVSAAHLQSAPRRILLAFITLLVAWGFVNNSKTIQGMKTPEHYFANARARVYVINDIGWLKTVNDTTEFLNKNLNKDELFFAIPYEPLYYYLTRKKSPTRQLVFGEFLKIRPPQEEKTIRELEENHVNWVLLSSRSASPEGGLGVLGKDYCPLIADYINKNFTSVVRFGDWTNVPGWAWNHGTLILKRK
ncbi:MAG: hypothetical protein HQL16_05645 [Candidatus Omnitrophica bacterium]|nr:hypothetical protein [Candidatus Omnitrophota bacterium]